MKDLTQPGGHRTHLWSLNSRWQLDRTQSFRDHLPSEKNVGTVNEHHGYL